MDNKTLADMAQLARLTVEATDVPHYCTQLNQILHFVEQMQAVNTTNIEPLAHPLPDIYTHATHISATPWRIDAVTTDAVTAKDQRELLQRCAPLTQEGFYVVPPVIE